jgi:hypothetical protein
MFKKNLLKKFENITNCWRGGKEGGREGGELSFQCLRHGRQQTVLKPKVKFIQ